MDLRCGVIVRGVGPDPRNRNWKSRPWVLLGEPDAATGVVLVAAVAISTDVHLTPSHLAVFLPASDDGHERTGLTEKSVVVCTWIVQLAVGEIESVLGRVSKEEWDRILGVIGALAE